MIISELRIGLGIQKRCMFLFCSRLLSIFNEINTIGFGIDLWKRHIWRLFTHYTWNQLRVGFSHTWIWWWWYASPQRAILWFLRAGVLPHFVFFPMLKKCLALCFIIADGFEMKYISLYCSIPITPAAPVPNTHYMKCFYLFPLIFPFNFNKNN